MFLRLPKVVRLLSVLCPFALGLPVAAVLLAPAPLHAQETEPLSLSVGNLSRTYTGLPVGFDPAADFTVSPGTAADYTFKITYPGRTAVPKNAGSYAVKVIATTKTLPASSVTATGTLVIAKAPLLVGANDQVRLFGIANPALTLSYEGFVNGETVAVLDRRPVGSTTAKPASPAGTYDITVSGGTDNNYALYGYNTGQLAIVPAFAGTYETLFFDSSAPNVPAGKLSLTLPATGGAYTGRLELAHLGAVLPLSGKLQPDLTIGGATGLASRKTGANDTYQVAFNVGPSGLFAEIFLFENGSDEQIPLYSVPPLARLASFTKAAPSPAAGAYTFVLLDPVLDSGFDLFPTGIGHATATIAVNGTLSLSGKFADGTNLVASALPDTEGRYRLFLRPYGARPGSFASGEFLLEPHLDVDRADRFYVPTSSLRTLYWRKAQKPAAPLDALFPSGFEVVNALVALDPWTPPAKAKAVTTTAPAVPAVTLAQRLGLASGPDSSGFAFLDYGATYLGESEDELPGAVEVTTANKLAPVLVAPPANPRAWKITSLNLANGRFTGSFTLADTIAATGKPHKRTVTFQGILRQPPAGDTTVGAGYFILKPVPGGFDTDIRSLPLILSRGEE